MWAAKFKAMHKDCHIVPRCERFKVMTYAFPAGASGGIFRKEGNVYLTAIHIIKGEEDNKKAFLEDLKTDKRVIRLEIHGDKFSYLFKVPEHGEHIQLYYNPELIFLKPVINKYDGYEYWEIGSWDRDIISEFIETVKKHMDHFELLKLEQTKLVDVYFPNILPNLSKKQKQAIELALKEGYYEYPRKIELSELARIMKVSTPTLQEHLRKAENKLLPDLIRQQL